MITVDIVLKEPLTFVATLDSEMQVSMHGHA